MFEIQANKMLEGALSYRRSMFKGTERETPSIAFGGMYVYHQSYFRRRRRQHYFFVADHSRAMALRVELLFIRLQNGPYFSVCL